MDKDIKYLVALNHFLKFGPVKLYRLKKAFENYEKAFKAHVKELISAGIDEKTANEFVSTREQLNPDTIMERLQKEEIKCVTIDDKTYPKLLKEIYSPPPLLYYKGQLSKSDSFSLSIVGTRKHSAYGKRAAEDISFELAKNNISIISGLALGIDAIAHSGAMKAGGRTVAILGTGIDKQSIYPATNRYIADQIINSGGMLVTEFPLGTPPLKHHFPQRNRIISGMSLGTIVIEAAKKSGALITAYHALEQNREVFSVPGPIYSLVSVGPHELIKRGSHIVTSASDILEALDLKDAISYIDTMKIAPETDEEKVIIKLLSHEPVHVNELVRASKLDTSKINSTLMIMEMKGMIKNIGNQEYILSRKSSIY